MDHLGVALLRALAAIGDLSFDGDKQWGVKIVTRALEEPLRQIAANSGDDGSIVIQKVREGEGSFGFNAQTGVYGDLFEMGIIDPTKVVRTALQNAASVASLMVTTEAIVAERPKDDKPMAGGPPGGGMGGMGDYDF